MTLVTGQQTMTVRDVLRQVLFLKNAPEAAIDALINTGHERRLGRGEVVFAELERCLGLVVVLRGAVKTYKLDSRGRELTLGVETAGTSLGEPALFDGGNYPYHAEAVSEDTGLWVTPRDSFRSVLRAHPEIAERGLLTLGIRLRQMISLAGAQSLSSVRARLAAYLLEASSGRPSFRLDETNDSIAGRLGTAREVVSRTLRYLKDMGVISLNGREVSIRDPAGLRRIAEDADLPA